jgi:hypothetical protein
MEQTGFISMYSMILGTVSVLLLYGGSLLGLLFEPDMEEIHSAETSIDF